MIYNGIDLNFVCRDYLSSLQLLCLCEGLKPLIRLNAYVDQLELYKNFCQQNSLSYYISAYKIIDKDGRIGFSSKKDWTFQESAQGYHYIYLAKDPTLLKSDLDNISDRDFGKLLGYPECCLDAYDCNVNQVRMNKIDFTALTIESSDPASFYVNTLIRYFRYALIQHFPCSVECADSLKMGEQVYTLLQEKYPQIANQFRNQLTCFAIHLGETEIYYANDFTESVSPYGKRIKFSTIKYIQKNELYKDLMEFKEVEIISPRIIKIGDKVVTGEYLRTIIYK